MLKQFNFQRFLNKSHYKTKHIQLLEMLFNLLYLIQQENYRINQFPKQYQDKVIIQKQHRNFLFIHFQHQQDIQSMLQNGKQTLVYTPYIKIKFNNNIQRLIDLLILLDKHQVGIKWIIDANACWLPQNYKLFQSLFEQIQNPIHIATVSYFLIFKDKKNNQVLFKIQVTNGDQQNKILNFSLLLINHLFQFKVMKKLRIFLMVQILKCKNVGGPIQAVKNIKQIKNNNIQHFMFGSMVSTNLGCTQTFQFNGCATYFDIDGGLLVKQPNIKGGFQWSGQKGIKQILGKGLALDVQDLQKMFNQ